MGTIERIWNRVPLPGLISLVCLDVVVGVALRFSTTSRMWLDEVLSVNISQRSLGQIVEYLRHDGAPPLYYFLLHFWIKVAGGSDFSVRALSGAISVATLPLVFVVARRLWGLQVGLIAVAVTAVTPYAVYFGNETRMYSLVMFEVAAFLTIWTSVWRVRDYRRIASLSLISTVMLYTHYWTLYFLLTVAAWSLWRALRGQAPRYIPRLLSLGVGVFLWLPWFPIFNVQRLHTGTPWSTPPNTYQLLTWVNYFAANQSVQHMTPSLHHQIGVTAFVGLLFVGLMTVPLVGRVALGIDLHVPVPARLMAVLGLGSVMVGLVAARAAGTTFVPRYAAIGAVPIFLLVARGISNFRTTLRIAVVLAVFSASMLWTDKWGRGVQRSQAGQVASVLTSLPNTTTVVTCPDQLGPSLLRYSRSDLSYISYPRGTHPDIIDWYDYVAAFDATSPSRFPAQFDRGTLRTGPLAVVWSTGYTLKSTCVDLVKSFSLYRAQDGQRLLKAKVQGFYQSMNVTFFPSSPRT